MLKKNRIKFYICLIILPFSQLTRGQDLLDLPELINRALLENYQILLVKNEEQIASNNNTIGNAGFLPTLDVQATNSRSNMNTRQEYFSGQTRQSDAAKSKNLNGLVILNWRVFDGLMMFARLDQLGYLKELGALNTKFFIEQTISDIAVTWFQLMRDYMILSNYSQTLDVSRYRLAQEKKKLDVGSGNLLLYNQALVDFSNDSIIVVGQKRNIRSLTIRINQLVNFDPDLETKFINSDIVPGILATKDSLVESAIAANQEINMAQLNEMIAQTNIRIQRADFFPEINLYGQYSFNEQNNQVSNTLYSKSFGRQLGVTVRLNLFNGLNERREVANAKIMKENSIFDRENTILQVKAAVLDNYYQYQSMMQQLILADQNTLSAQKSLDIAKIQYEQGTINGYDFRETQLSLIRAQIYAVNLRFTLKSAEIELTRLTGGIPAMFF
jgi:outer membrane protein TolC